MARRLMQAKAALAATIVLVGCARKAEVTLPAADPTLLAGADAVVIVAGSATDAMAPDGVAAGAGEGAASAIGQFADSMGGGGGGGGGAGAALLYLAVLAVGLPVSALVGAAGAHSAEETEAAKTAFLAALRDPGLLPSLQRRIAAKTAAGAPGRWPCVGLAAPDAAPPCPEAQAPATLEVRAGYAPVLDGAIDPEVRMAALVRARLTPPGGAPYEMRWRYDTPAQPYFEATADGAAGLRRALDTMTDRLAAAVARDMLVDPEPTTATYFEGGFAMDPRYGPAAFKFQPVEPPPGVARRMHPRERAPLALLARLDAVVVGHRINLFASCRIAAVDGVPPPPTGPIEITPAGESVIATAEPGAHRFRVACPGAGTESEGPFELDAEVKAGRAYCTDGRSFREVRPGDDC